MKYIRNDSHTFQVFMFVFPIGLGPKRVTKNPMIDHQVGHDPTVCHS